jgi:hypothetical protein
MGQARGGARQCIVGGFVTFEAVTADDVDVRSPVRLLAAGTIGFLLRRRLHEPAAPPGGRERSALAEVLRHHKWLIAREATPPAVRCTAIALGFNAANGLMGGLAPLVSTWLVHRAGMDLSPAFLVMAAAAVSFAAVPSLRETRPQAPERRLAHS